MSAVSDEEKTGTPDDETEGEAVSAERLIDMLRRQAEADDKLKAFDEAFGADALRACGIDAHAPVLTRIDAAIMLHTYMLKVAGIADLEDISAASVLKDLYDCRKCVNHIAQVYLRGLIKPRRLKMPGGAELLLFDAKGEFIPTHVDKFFRMWYHAACG